MTKSVGNWVSESTASTGTGAITLSGNKTSDDVTTFSNAVNSGLIYYSIKDGDNREAGIGTYDGGVQIQRTQVTATLLNGVYNDVNPVPLNLSGNAVVSCTFTSHAYRELLQLIEDAGGGPIEGDYVLKTGDTMTGPLELIYGDSPVLFIKTVSGGGNPGIDIHNQGVSRFVMGYNSAAQSGGMALRDTDGIAELAKLLLDPAGKFIYTAGSEPRLCIIPSDNLGVPRIEFHDENQNPLLQMGFFEPSDAAIIALYNTAGDILSRFIMYQDARFDFLSDTDVNINLKPVPGSPKGVTAVTHFDNDIVRFKSEFSNLNNIYRMSIHDSLVGDELIALTLQQIGQASLEGTSSPQLFFRPDDNTGFPGAWMLNGDGNKVFSIGIDSSTNQGAVTLVAVPTETEIAKLLFKLDGNVELLGTGNNAPVVDGDLATKKYVDDIASGAPPGTYVQRSGDTMDGNLAGPDPVGLTDYTNRQWVEALVGGGSPDTFVLKAGDTMDAALKGPDPVDPTDYTTKQWVESQVGSGAFVPLDGSSDMTDSLMIIADSNVSPGVTIQPFDNTGTPGLSIKDSAGNQRFNFAYDAPSGAGHLVLFDNLGVEDSRIIFQIDGNVSLTSAPLPTNASHLTRKDYVDNQITGRVDRLGDTMTNPLKGPEPVASNDYATKNYVDSNSGGPGGDFVQITGDTMTGPLSIVTGGDNALTLKPTTLGGDLGISIEDLNAVRYVYGYDTISETGGSSLVNLSGQIQSRILQQPNSDVVVSGLTDPSVIVHNSNNGVSGFEVRDNSATRLTFNFLGSSGYAQISLRNSVGASVNTMEFDPAGYIIAYNSPTILPFGNCLTTKDYVDDKISSDITGKINRSGDTMSGALSGPYPTSSSQYATKQYVDDNSGGGGGSFVPLDGSLDMTDDLTIRGTNGSSEMHLHLTNVNNTVGVDCYDVAGNQRAFWGWDNTSQYAAMGSKSTTDVLLSGLNFKTDGNIERTGLLPTPTAPQDLATKAYVDQVIAAALGS